MNAIFTRAQRLLNLADYSNYVAPVDCGNPSCDPPTDRQYILRMMVQRANDDLTIPTELKWLEGVIRDCSHRQLVNGLNPKKDFIYVTVRHGIVTTETDDLWHVDGFSMRISHRPEQNYIYSNIYPTEILSHGFDIPVDFNPHEHNIHMFFQDRADSSKTMILPEGRLFLIDPYIVHRRQKASAGKMRTFYRISFIPIEIDDDTCTPNPLLPNKVYQRDGVQEVRDKLRRY